MRIFLFLFCFVLVSCGEQEQKPADEKPPELFLKKSSFEVLPGWGTDDFDGFFQAFSRSCDRIFRKSATASFGVLEQAGTYAEWKIICQDFHDTEGELSPAFFEAHFTPFAVYADEEPEGLFTGYYEASLRGSFTKDSTYNVPLYTRPDDLVMVHLGEFREELKGVRIAGRVKGGTLKPYENRAEIVSGDWPHNDKVLLWVDSAVDAFFVQIQGSGVVQMNNGETVRIGYAGQNGHPYYAIGRELITRGALTKETVSMQTIRAWLEDNPDQADEIMNTNRSYVFFRKIKGEGPLGAEGVALTAERSLAIDRVLLSYGLPVWVDIEPPVGAETPLRKMMVAQDTGGAIQGPVRGDVFWGYGARAENMAGQMKSRGRYWILLPK